jgi:hypothetical protein
MDTRLIVIAAPLLIAGSWAFNIGRLLIPTSSTFNVKICKLKLIKEQL